MSANEERIEAREAALNAALPYVQLWQRATKSLEKDQQSLARIEKEDVRIERNDKQIGIMSDKERQEYYGTRAKVASDLAKWQQTVGYQKESIYDTADEIEQAIRTTLRARGISGDDLKKEVRHLLAGLLVAADEGNLTPAQLAKIAGDPRAEQAPAFQEKPLGSIKVGDTLTIDGMKIPVTPEIKQALEGYARHAQSTPEGQGPSPVDGSAKTSKQPDGPLPPP